MDAYDVEAEEEARLKAEEEARLKAEEGARLIADAEARQKAEDKARLEAEAQTQAQAAAEEHRIEDAKVLLNIIPNPVASNFMDVELLKRTPLHYAGLISIQRLCIVGFHFWLDVDRSM